MEPLADLRQHLQRGRCLGAHVPSVRWAYLLTILSTFYSACNAPAGKTTLPGSAVGRRVGHNASPVPRAKRLLGPQRRSTSDRARCDGVGLRGPKGFRDRRGPALRGRGYCSRAGLGVDRQSFARPAYRPSNPPAFLAAAAAWFIVIRHVGKLAARPADALLRRMDGAASWPWIAPQRNAERVGTAAATKPDNGCEAANLLESNVLPC